MAKVIAICGKICSGKTYYAKELKQKENAVILSTDEATWELIENEQGEFYDKFCLKVNNYLRKKAIDIVNAGCNVILDWGFWTKKDRNEIKEYYKNNNIKLELHYIDITEDDWENNIKMRNEKIENGENKQDFFVTEGLKEKVIKLFEIPDIKEIDVWYEFGKK